MAEQVYVMFDLDQNFVAPERAMRFLLGQIGGVLKPTNPNETYRIPCAKRDTAPSIYFNVGNVEIELKPQDYIFDVG